LQGNSLPLAVSACSIRVLLLGFPEFFFCVSHKLTGDSFVRCRYTEDTNALDTPRKHVYLGI
jgi:hypothetical protein